MIHPIDVPTATSLRELGEKVAQLRYDAEIAFFEAYVVEKRRQRLCDEARKRFILCGIGEDLVTAGELVCTLLRQMFKLSTPYMKDELLEFPLEEEQTHRT